MNAPRKTNFFYRVVVPFIILTYTLAALATAVYLAWLAWPANPVVLGCFERRVMPKLLSEITSESLTTLIQAQDAVSRWRIQGTGQLTAADRDVVHRGMILASEVTTNRPPENQLALAIPVITTNNAGEPVTNSPPIRAPSLPISLPVSGDLRRVTRADVIAAGEKLDMAIASLRNRAAALEEVLCKTNKHDVLERFCLLCVFQDHQPPAPRLASSEKAELNRRKAELLGNDAGLPKNEQAYFGGSKAIALLVILAAFGVIGGVTHTFNSVAQYLGRRKFLARWGVFYLIRPLTGALLATGFYFVLAAGLISVPLAGTGKDQITVLDVTNLKACCALAWLIGLFSGEAIESLRDVAAAVFKSNKSSDSVDDRPPSIAYTRVAGFPLLIPQNILNLSALAEKLKPGLLASGPGASPPTSPTPEGVLASALLNPVRTLLDQKSSETDPQLEEALVKELNRLLKAKFFVGEPVFNEAQLSVEIEPLVRREEKSTDKDSKLRLNRLLLENAFPGLFATWVVFIFGTEFRPDSLIFVDGKPLATDEKAVYTSKEKMIASLSIKKHQPGKISVAVSNPEGGGLSDAVEVNLP